MTHTTLKTDRLWLRRPQPEDAGALFRCYTSDQEVLRYSTWPAHTSIDQTVAFFEGKWSTADPKSRWSICLANDETPIGMISASHDCHTCTLGYALGRPHWGGGIMTEVVQTVVAHLWRDHTVWRVEARTHVDNTASMRVLEKSGFQREGILRRADMLAQFDVPQHSVVYAQTRDDIS